MTSIMIIIIIIAIFISTPVPPLRNEIKHLNFTFQRKKDNDYIWLDNDGEIFKLLDIQVIIGKKKCLYKILI